MNELLTIEPPTPVERRTARVFTLLWTIGVVVWLLAAMVFGRTIVEMAFAGEGFDYITRLMKRRQHHTVDYYVDYWNRFVLLSGVVFVGLGLFGRALFSGAFFQSCVRPASPDHLGWIRMLTFGCMLASALWEHIPSTAHLPRDMFTGGVGVIRLLAALPGFSEFIASETLLRCFQYATIATVAAAMCGLFTRFTVPVGTAMYLVAVGLLRSYSWPYHTGILTMYVGIVLSFTPCNATWSLDALRRSRRGVAGPDPSRKTDVYGWSVFACYVVLSLALAAAGLSKARNGGLSWVHPDNFRSILFGSSLMPMQFDFGVSQHLWDAPDWVFSGMAISAIGLQIACVLQLFLPSTRRILPALVSAMHVVIWVLQNILFFEVILLQLAFYDIGGIQNRARRLFSGLRRDTGDADSGEAVSPRRLPQMVLVWGTTCVMMTVWLAKFEFYPLTGMQMFSRPTLGNEITYYKVLAHFDSGDVRRAPLEECIPALRDSRYRHMLKASFNNKIDVARQYFEICMNKYNGSEGRSPSIAVIEVQKWKWTYRSEPVNGEFGQMLEARLFPHVPQKRTTDKSSRAAVN